MQLVRAPEFMGAGNFETAERRYGVVLAARLISDPNESHIPIRICNISAGGLMAAVPPHLDIEGHVSIIIRHAGKLSGHVVWSGRGRIGVRFDREIDPAAFLADRAERAAAPSRMANRFVELAKGAIAVPGMDFPIDGPAKALHAV